MQDDATEDDVPRSRCLTHLACGGVTPVGGEDFKALADPLNVRDTADCIHCRAPFPLEEFAWTDSRERLTDYRARYLALVPTSGRYLVGCGGCLMTALLGMACGMAAGWALAPLIGPFLGGVAAVLGVPVGLFASAWFWGGYIQPSVYRQAFGTTEPRSLR